MSAQDVKPNIVFILVDNVGWGDWSVYGGTTPTPRIDKLASEGIRFNNYNVEAQCTPSRSAIMTGRQSVRSGTFKVPLPGSGPSGLAPWEYTIAELLSDAGYATALYGKWHLGAVEGRLPTNQGFDEWWGIKNSWEEAGYTSWAHFDESGEPVPMIWEGKKGQPSTPVMPLDLHVRPIVDEKYIVPKTIDFIQRNAAAKKPFFVYVGYSEMHPPAMANPGFSKAGDPYGKYSDLVREMDFRVGQILDAIKEAGADNNTIVVLTSDNGAGLAEGGGVITQPQGGSSGPWRGNFFTPGFEGSYRTCGMIRWPGHIPSGMVTEEILSAHDWLPTLAGFVGASQLVPTDRPIDGRDASDFLLGKSPTTGSDSYLFFGPDGGPMSVKWKTYKILFRYCEDIEKPLVTPQLPMIYDLSSDPHEDWNIIKTRLDTDWLLTPAMKVLMAFEASVKKYPNIKPGEDFKGY